MEKKVDKVKKQGIEIGSQAAEKSKVGEEIRQDTFNAGNFFVQGLFSAEDWQCAKCGNVNWARRSTCNLCGAPKFTEVYDLKSK